VCEKKILVYFFVWRIYFLCIFCVVLLPRGVCVVQRFQRVDADFSMVWVCVPSDASYVGHHAAVMEYQ
jgi:hypothetical protein